MSKSIPVAVRFDNELNSFLTRVVQREEYNENRLH